MSGIPKRNYGALGNKLHADTNRALKDVGDRVTALAYTPADPASWADPPPTSVYEALDRIAARIHALHPGSEP